VAATTWKDGKGDVLGDLAESCRKYGLKLGVYISPWDRNHPEYGREAYIEDFFEQWRETLTNYGEVFEVWFDGANGGTGYYGGARESRSIDKDYYRFPEVFRLIKGLQPQAIFFGHIRGVTTDTARWVGNESGYAGETHWHRFAYDRAGDDRGKLETGLEDGAHWMPAEADTTLLWPKAWYYHTGTKPRTLRQLLDVYYATVGRGATFNLGIAIAPDGRITPADERAMLALRAPLDREFAEDLAAGATVVADNVRGGDSAFSPKNCIDGDTDTYWATDDGVGRATLTLEFGTPTRFNRLMLQERIALGQRIRAFRLEAEVGGEWREATSGTTVGYKRLARFETVEASRVRLTLETDAPCLTLSRIGLYNAPVLLSDPVITADREGTVTIEGPAGATILYAIGDGDDTDSFVKYEGPFALPSGGRVRACAADEATGARTDVVAALFGASKAGWKIVGCSYPNRDGGGAVERLIDGDPSTMWHTHGKDDGRVQPPHWVAIDLGGTVPIAGFTCMPRHDGTHIGMVDQYAFHVSEDGVDWGDPVAAGEFANVLNNPVEQVVRLPAPVSARYIKFVARRAVRENSCAAVCEIGVLVE